MEILSEILGRDIVIVAQQPWDIEIGTNIKNIAKEFSKKNRVLYVNSPLDRITKYKNKNHPDILKRVRVINGTEVGLVSKQENLWVVFPDKIIESINWIKNKTLFSLFNKLNNKRFAASIKKTTEILGFSNIILFNDNDIFRSFYLKELLKPDISIYYSRDYMLGVSYWAHHGKKLEPLLIAKSDICVANSTYLTAYCKKYNPLSYYIGQGCDKGMFKILDEKDIPDDMVNFSKPIIGYVGALNTLRLDIDIIEHIANSNPDWNIVLVGFEDEEFLKCKLHLIPNIYFLGLKGMADLPRYINSFNVCINPQRLNEVTIGNYPLKIDEYLALGKPTVAKKTDGMKVFGDYTYLAETKEEFVLMIKKALKEDNALLKSDRKIFVSSHTWENCVKEIYTAINSINNPLSNKL